MMNNRWIAATLALALMAAAVPDSAEARRFGGGRAIGMQRQAPPPKAPPQNTPPQQAQPATPGQTAPNAGVPAAGATTAAAAAGRRSWMGPIAGLAAGLGLAALASHFGFGEGLANFMMLMLLALVGFAALRMLMSRMAGARPREAVAGAGAATARAPWAQPGPPAAAERAMTPAAGDNVSVTGVPLAPLGVGPAAAVRQTSQEALGLNLPAGFDLPAFERVAKLIFIRMQAANDKADLDDLREFTTPEMFAAVRLDLQERHGAAQQTDVERVDAKLIDFADEPTRQVASVRFTGLVREEAHEPPEPFDEVWHLVKPADGSRAWAIAGIQQPQ
jgi:predicted lipid-binding transport protein (Tim44 family)